MNNFVIKLKKFITNKTVVTIVGVLLVLVILFFGYTSSIKEQTNPVNVPVAAKKINARTRIKSEDVVYAEVASRMVGENVIRSSNLIVGKYTNINVTIPQGSMFYSEWIIDGEDIKGNWIEGLDYADGKVGYYMSVDAEDTLGNNVLPDTYIDIYMKATDENGTIMFGKLLKNVKVLVVHDGSGNNVFEDGESIGTPSKIGFAVSQDVYVLLKKAGYLNVELVVLPKGSTVPSGDYSIVSSSTLRDYIDAQTITIDEDIVVEDVQNPDQNGEIVE